MRDSRPDPEAIGEERRLTGRAQWDQYWAELQLPLVVKRNRHTLYLNAILDAFDRFFPRDDTLTALELGGAPGQYLAYLHRRYGYRVSCLDYSTVGCAGTKENFRLLDIPVDVYEADLFDESVTLPSFDIVYSLGLIEHFDSQSSVVRQHVRFLKPGGLLVLGVPNFQGVNGWFLSRLAPRLLQEHQLSAMNLQSWRTFEQELGLAPVFKQYVGGFEPSIFLRREDGSRGARAPFLVARMLTRLLHSHFRFLRHLNGRLWSGYAIGAYRLQDRAEG